VTIATSPVRACQLAELRQDLLADARMADDDLSFDLECRAWNIERHLRSGGFDIATGRPARKV
jgi:hypothetical protein